MLREAGVEHGPAGPVVFDPRQVGPVDTDQARPLQTGQADALGLQHRLLRGPEPRETRGVQGIVALTEQTPLLPVGDAFHELAPAQRHALEVHAQRAALAHRAGDEPPVVADRPVPSRGRRAWAGRAPRSSRRRRPDSRRALPPGRGPRGRRRAGRARAPVPGGPGPASARPPRGSRPADRRWRVRPWDGASASPAPRCRGIAGSSTCGRGKVSLASCEASISTARRAATPARSSERSVVSAGSSTRW